MAENPIQEPDPPFDLSLRPPGFAEFHGQAKVTERLMLMVEAARQREDVLEHILLDPDGRPSDEVHNRAKQAKLHSREARSEPT